MASASQERQGDDRMRLLSALSQVVPNLRLQEGLKELNALREHFANAAAASSRVNEAIEIFKGGEEFDAAT